MNSNWLVLVVGVAAIGCTEENSNSGGIDANGAIDATVIDAGSTPDADGFCEFVPTPVMPFPEPTIVAPGTACVGDDDCTLVGGFCRPLSAGGSECATFQGNTEPCGGLTAPAEQQRCLPALSCDAVNAQTMGTCVCTPNCVDKVCGSDGCGSTCGDCDEVCAAEGTVCNDFEGDQCCRPAVVTQLPYERVGNTEGAEDTFDVPPGSFGSNQPDEIIRFTPPVTGEYFVWGSCHEGAVYSSCGDSNSRITAFSCIGGGDFVFDEPTRFQFDAENEYFFAEEESYDRREYIRRIHGPITSIANLATSRVYDIVTDDTHVYWSSGTSVYRHAIDGSGLTSVVLSSSSLMRDIEVFGDNVYTINNGLVLKALKTGGAPTVLASGQAGRVTASAGYLYWAISAQPGSLCDPFFPTEPTGVIRRIPLQGGAIEDVATGQLVITDIDSDENHVYWTASDGDFSIDACKTGSMQRRSHAGGPIETFADTLSYSRVVVGENDVYIAYRHYRHNVGEIYDWSRYSKNTLDLAHTFDPVNEAADAALDSSGFYLTGSYTNTIGNVAGGVFKSSESGAPIGLVPSFIYNRTQIAATQGRLFFNFDDEILSVPLP